MAFIAFALAALFSILLWLISGRYRPRFAGRERVVMNWSFGGQPNYYASPRVALSFTPAVGTVSLLLLAGAVSLFAPQDKQLLALPVVAFVGW